MAIFRGRRVSQRGGAGAGRGDNPHTTGLHWNIQDTERFSGPHDWTSMSFDEHHKIVSHKKGPRDGLFMVKTNKSPYGSQHQENLARQDHADAVKRRKHNEMMASGNIPDDMYR